MKRYCMDTKSINIQRVIYLILLIVIYCIIKYLSYILSVSLSDSVLFVIFIIMVAGYIFAAMILIPMVYNRTAYCVDEDYMHIIRGFLKNSNKYIKVKSIQFVTLISVPVLDRSGFCFLIIGGYGTRTVLTFLSQNDSKEIAEFLRNRISKNNGSKDGVLQ